MGGAIHDQALAGLPQYVQDGLRSLAKRTNFLAIMLFAGQWIFVLMAVTAFTVNPENLYCNKALDCLEQLASQSPLLCYGSLILTICWGLTFTIAYSAWAYRANKNLEFMAVEGVANTPGDAMFWHLVPWAMVVMIFRVLRELWRASDPDQPIGTDANKIPTDRMIKVWYGIYLTGILVGFLFGLYLGLKASSSGSSILAVILIEWQLVKVLLMITITIYIVGAIVKTIIIKKLFARQVDRAKKINAREPDKLLPEHIERFRLQAGLDAVWRRRSQVSIICIICGLLALIELVEVGAVINYIREPIALNFLSALEITNKYAGYLAMSEIAFWLLLMWSYSCHRNLEAMKVTGIRYSPLKTVFWWFIPVFNLFGGAKTINEMWCGSNPGLSDGADIKDSDKFGLIPLTMVSLAGLILVPIAYWWLAVHSSVHPNIALIWSYLIHLAIKLITIIMIIIIVRKISEYQLVRAEMIYGRGVLPDIVFAGRGTKHQAALPTDKDGKTIEFWRP